MLAIISVGLSLIVAHTLRPKLYLALVGVNPIYSYVQQARGSQKDRCLMLNILLVWDSFEGYIVQSIKDGMIISALDYNTKDYKDALHQMLKTLDENDDFNKVLDKFVSDYLNNDIRHLQTVIGNLEWDDNHREVFKDFVIRFLESHTNDHEAALWGIDEGVWKNFLEFIGTL